MNHRRSTDCLAFLFLLTALMPIAAHGDRMTLREARDFVRSFAIEAGAQPTLVIDNVFGSITVRPGTANAVHLKIKEVFRAVDAREMRRARDEVELVIAQDGNDVRVLIDGPFRCDDRFNCIRWDRRDYHARYTFEVTVPPTIDLTLRTVSDGDIDVEGVRGVFAVENVNGAVALDGVGGHGEAVTVNGGVTLRLRDVPTGDWLLKTVNGDVETYAPASLHADLHFATTFGDAFSEFDVAAVPPPRAPPQRRDGLFVLSREPGFFGRIGSGGPQLRCATLNGDIALRRTTRPNE